MWYRVNSRFGNLIRLDNVDGLVELGELRVVRLRGHPIRPDEDLVSGLANQGVLDPLIPAPRVVL
jgi:hypothetical protein